ncbi:hypothetical protein [Shinella zoogloeoides]
MGDLHGAHDLSQNQTVAGASPARLPPPFRRKSERASGCGASPLQNAESVAQTQA